MGVPDWSSPWVGEFVRPASRIENVCCVVVEDASDGVVHRTTFADPLSENTRDAIYAIEARTIDLHPDLLFDFHLRNSSETIG
jgi:hypothetical protein